jgi:uncharacterized protein
VAIHAWWTSAAPPPPLTLASLSRAVDAAARQESYLALLSARWSLFAGAFHVSWRDILPDVNLALFILGLLAVRHGIFDAPKRHVRVIAGWMMFGAAAWACSWLVLPHLPAIPIPGAMSPIEYGLGLVQDQWLCFTYIGAIVLLLAFRPAWTARLAIFGLAGRMALTNYLMQAAVLDALSSGYGANLKLRPFVYPLAAVVLFGAQVIISRVWLARYRFGPLEWLWRAATYARVPPLRRVHVEVQPT